jgi:DNA-binding transcriptional MerR regulator
VAAARSAAVRTSAGQSLLSIGQVLQRLTGEFPDLSPSKLRFLEDRELIKPGRTPAGYRTYSTQDVDRLRFILGVQRDHYLPLKVIKQYLDDVDAGLSPELPGVTKLLQPAVVGRVGAMDKKELCEKAGASVALVDEAISQGLIPAGKLFDQHHLRIVETLVLAREFGLTPRHLRGLSLQVEREVDLVVRAVGSRRSANPKQQRSSSEAHRELAEVVGTLRQVLMRQALDGLES